MARAARGDSNQGFLLFARRPIGFLFFIFLVSIVLLSNSTIISMDQTKGCVNGFKLLAINEEVGLFFFR